MIRTEYFEWMVGLILEEATPPVEETDTEEAYSVLISLLQKVPDGKPTLRYTALEVQWAIEDRETWAHRGSLAPVLPAPIAKWRHWKPSRTAETDPITQRQLEKELRLKWAQRLVALLAPFADKIPHMAKVMGPNQEREWLDLLGDTRFRTLRIHCLALENLQASGLTQIPWTESDVRDLLNRLREAEASPHKIQRVWETLKWFPKRFGFLSVEASERLIEKKKTLQEEGVDTVARPQRKAILPTEEVIWALEEVASGGGVPSAHGEEPLSPKGALDQYICGVVRFQVACSARFNDLQHTIPTAYKFHGGTIELQAWQTKTVSAFRSKKSPVPLLAPTYSFTGRDWWSPLMTAWQKMGTLETFKGVDYIIPTVSKDYTGVLARPSAADRALRWLKAALHRHGGVDPAHLNKLTWHSFRVFVPDCAYQLGFPRDQRQYLGNWTTETTADIYTRDKKNVVEKVWKAVRDKMGILKLDEPNQARRIDLNHEDWDDPDMEMPLARALNLDTIDLVQEGAQPPEPKLKKRRSPLSVGSWEAISEGRPLPPPLGPLRVVAATKKARGSQTFKVHLLTQEGRAIGCGWEPPATKALDLDPEISSMSMALVFPPAEVPADIKEDVEKLHQSVRTLLITKGIPWQVMARLATEGYVTMEDLADRWDTAATARTAAPAELGFAHNAHITDAQEKFVAMRIFQNVRHAKQLVSTLSGGPSETASPTKNQLAGGLDSLCDRKQLLTNWDNQVKLPRPKLEFQGSDAYLKKQWKCCSQGEIGWFQMKHIVSALPEMDERPIKTRRQVTVNGWEREDEDEERKAPTTRDQLKRAHQVFRNTLLMCVISFPQFSQFDVKHQDLEDWYAFFWGKDIADRKPAPSESVLLYAERNAWREIHNRVYEGASLKTAMTEQKADTLFWQREEIPQRLRDRLPWQTQPHPPPDTRAFVLVLYAGDDDKFSLKSAMLEKSQHWPVDIREIDNKRPGHQEDHDMLRDQPYSDLCHLALQGKIRGLLGGPNCRTWSILRWFPKPNAPVPVRGRKPDHIWGLPSNTASEQEDTDNDSILLLRFLVLLTLAHEGAKMRGFPSPASFLEHPEDPADCSKAPVAFQCSSIWSIHWLRCLLQSLGLFLIHFDQCRFGQWSPKPTTVATNLPLHHWNHLRCDHQSHPKPPGGSSSDLSRYPWPMMLGIATALLEADFAQGTKPACHSISQSDRPTSSPKATLMSIQDDPVMDPDMGYPQILVEGVPLGVSTPTLESPGIWPTKEELRGQEDPSPEYPPLKGRDNYPSAKEFTTEIAATFEEEKLMNMVLGPFTQREAAQVCACHPDELCPGPMAGIQESDKVRTVFDGSWGGANTHIQANTKERTTAPTVMDCVQALHWLHAVSQSASRSANGEQGDTPDKWSPPPGDTVWILLKADITKAHRRIKVLQPDWKYQVAQLGPDAWWVNTVGTYGMASAQLYWGRMAALLLRLLYYIFPDIDWGFVFVDDFCWILRASKAALSSTTVLATLLALGVPLSWKKTVLSEINTWLGFVINPKTLFVRMGEDKHEIIMAILDKLQKSEVFTSKAIEKALGRISWATVCPLTRPFLQPFWSWKSACKTSGRPPKLVSLFASLLKMIFTTPYHQPSPYMGLSPWWGASDASGSKTSNPWIGGWISDLEFPNKASVQWFQFELNPQDFPWAFVDGDSTRRIAALEMLGTLILVSLLLTKSEASLLRLQLSLISDNQGNIFALLNSHTRKMPTAAFLMQLVYLLYEKRAQIAPSHCKRDHNQWADDLTHSEPQGFTPELRIDINPILRSFRLLPQILPDWQVPILPT
eukprot:s690_g21.t2